MKAGEINPGNGSQMEYAVALAEGGRPESWLAAMDEIPFTRIAGYLPYWTTHGYMLRSFNRKDAASLTFVRAASLTDAPPGAPISLKGQ